MPSSAQQEKPQVQVDDFSADVPVLRPIVLKLAKENDVLEEHINLFLFVYSYIYFIAVIKIAQRLEENYQLNLFWFQLWKIIEVTLPHS